jgi:hypothetical protein
MSPLVRFDGGLRYGKALLASYAHGELQSVPMPQWLYPYSLESPQLARICCVQPRRVAILLPSRSATSNCSRG